MYAATNKLLPFALSPAALKVADFVAVVVDALAKAAVIGIAFSVAIQVNVYETIKRLADAAAGIPNKDEIDQLSKALDKTLRQEVADLGAALASANDQLARLNASVAEQRGQLAASEKTLLAVRAKSEERKNILRQVQAILSRLPSLTDELRAIGAEFESSLND
jgi:predicted  nucleic acid-binding Zn-ribbon protein